MLILLWKSVNLGIIILITYSYNAWVVDQVIASCAVKIIYMYDNYNIPEN